MSGSSLKVIMSGEDHLMRDVNDYRNNNENVTMLHLIDLGLAEDFLTEGNNNGGRSYLEPVVVIRTGKMPTENTEDAPIRTSFIDSADTKMPAESDRTHLMYHVNPNYDTNEKLPAASSQSDEELARKLAAEWGSLPDQEEVVTMSMKSDEEYARNLQAIWDVEVTGGDHGASSAIEVSSHVATTDEVASLLASDDEGAHHLEGEKMMMDESMTSTINNTAMDTSTPTAARSIEETTTTSIIGVQSQYTRQRPLNFERHGHSFPLFHYNGLRGGKMTCFRVQKLSPTEAVGASIASSSTVGQQHGCSSGGACDLEDIIRTKWPSSLVNWFGEPPSID